MEILDIKEFLTDLEYIINIDSGSNNLQGNEKIVKFFQEKYSKIGYTAEIKKVGKNNRPLLIARNEPSNNPEFLLLGHLDTVFADGTAARRPFSINEDKAFGPGTVDMKAGALLMYYIARHLSKVQPGISLVVANNTDEEIGSVDSKEELVKLGQEAECCFVFEGARKNGQFVNERRGIAKYSLSIKGKASHSGTAPHLGASAIVELGNWIVRMDKLKNYAKGTTVNVGLIKGGSALNVVAEKAEALMEVRYTNKKEFQRVEGQMEKLVKNPYVDGTISTLTRLSHYDPLIPNKRTEAVMKMMEEVGKTNDIPINFVKAGGISDANRLGHLDLAIIDGCGPSGGFPHNEGEFLAIETVQQRYELMIKILLYIHKNNMEEKR